MTRSYWALHLEECFGSNLGWEISFMIDCGNWCYWMIDILVSVDLQQTPCHMEVDDYILANWLCVLMTSFTLYVQGITMQAYQMQIIVKTFALFQKFLQIVTDRPRLANDMAKKLPFDTADDILNRWTSKSYTYSWSFSLQSQLETVFLDWQNLCKYTCGAGLAGASASSSHSACWICA